jgi:hypothetical protein
MVVLVVTIVCERKIWRGVTLSEVPLGGFDDNQISDFCINLNFVRGGGGRTQTEMFLKLH